MAASPEPHAIIDADGDFEGAAVAKIAAALASPTEIVCNNTPLTDVVEHLGKRHKIEIQLDTCALKEAGIEPNCPVTKSLSGISLRSALRQLLREMQLEYVIRNEVLLITTTIMAESDEYAATRIYPVKDLVLVRNEHGEIETDFQSLIDLIENVIPPGACTTPPGCLRGSIASYQFQDRCVLVISDTQAAHERIADLLAALRRCSVADAKQGKELCLPKRPSAAAPYLIPAGTPANR